VGRRQLHGAAGRCRACVAADNPADWLARTDRALATLNYEGVFVHEHAGETETLRVIHRVGSDGVSERLLSMDGSGREFIRKGSQLTCYLPDQRTVLVERASEARLLLGGLPHIDATSAGLYRITELQKMRVSGRDARVIAVTPMDQMRYGYRVWIDEATAMPLKTQLRNGQGQVLEQIVFTDLRLPAHICQGRTRAGGRRPQLPLGAAPGRSGGIAAAWRCPGRRACCRRDFA
jgi:sigma-E factor negative regulatory protein RseB